MELVKMIKERIKITEEEKEILNKAYILIDDIYEHCTEGSLIDNYSYTIKSNMKELLSKENCIIIKEK